MDKFRQDLTTRINWRKDHDSCARELLISFADWHLENVDSSEAITDKNIEDFLNKSNL
jgi:hypothetical protein